MHGRARFADCQALWPGAVPALEAGLLGEGLLDRMQPPVRQPLDCGAERPATPAAVGWQASTGVPSTSTVQALHSPSPQPGLAAVRPRPDRGSPSGVPDLPGLGSHRSPFTMMQVTGSAVSGRRPVFISMPKVLWCQT